MPQMPDQPWSPVEVVRAMQGTIDELEEAVALLKSLGVTAAQKANEYRRAESHWMMRAKADYPDLKSEGARKAWVWENTDVPQLELERSIAEHHYKDANVQVRSLQTQADLLRSMKRGYEDMSEGWGPSASETKRIPNEQF